MRKLIFYILATNLISCASAPEESKVVEVSEVTYCKKLSDNINHEAHLYGAIYGIVFTLLIYPPAGLEFFEQILSYRIF